MKCFNFDGETYIDIDINLLRSNTWSVPFDWIGVVCASQIKLEEIDRLVQVLEEVEGVKLDEQAKTRHIQTYLSEVYLKSHFEEIKRDTMKSRPPPRDPELEKLTKQNLKKEKILRELLADGTRPSPRLQLQVD